MRVKDLGDGYAILGDGADHRLMHDVRRFIGRASLIIADPPYGNIVKDRWDKVTTSDECYAYWMYVWTRNWEMINLAQGGAFYVWGGIGRPGFRPFWKYVTKVEEQSGLNLANLLTWGKRRGYGIQHNYLFTREECAYFCKGDIKKPRCFNVPHLTVERGYEGFNKKYPAKSKFKRRTNVWSDVTEILRGKVHPTQKAARVIEIPIEVHTQPGEWVIDPFAGSFTTAHAARRLGRRFVVIENDEKCFDEAVERLGAHSEANKVGSGT